MTKHVATTDDTKKAVSTVNSPLPDFMQGKQGAGTDNLDVSDMEIPRIKLIQAISPEVTIHDNIKPGEFWHTLAEESLGKEVRVVPVFIDRRYILWKPRKSGGGILARADDGVHWNPGNAEFQVQLDNKKNVTWRTKPTVEESGLAEWGSADPQDPNSQPAATLMYTFVVAMPDYPELGYAQLTLQRGSVTVAKNLIGKIRMHKAPSYGRVFKMASVDENGPSGPYVNYRFTADGFVQDETTFKAYEALYEQFRQKGLTIKDIETLNGDEAGGGAPASKNDKDF